MTPADKRMLDLLDRWLASIELHLKYVDLDEASYRQVQPWPEHERPARWILELAQQKVLQLKTLCKTHVANNDPSFAESLELMQFLATLVGVQNIKRFIPLADAAREQASAPPTDPVASPNPARQSKNSDDNITQEMPKLKTAQPRAQGEGESTREMPRLKVPARKSPAVGTRTQAEIQAKRTAAVKPASSPPAASQANNRAQDIVVADAVRLLKWGREWHELTELIARMAERPGAAEIRRILRTQKNSIEAQLRS